MPYRVNCPACKTVYYVPEDSLGKKLQCKKCHQPFTVGTPKAVAPPTPKMTATTGRPAAKPAVPREAVVSEASSAPPAPRKRTPIVIAAALLVLGGATVGALVAGLYFRKPPQETPIAQALAEKDDRPADTRTPLQPATEEAAKPIPAPITEKPIPQNDKPSSPSPPVTGAPQPPDPPVSNRDQLPRTAEVGKPFKYQLSRPMEKVRMYTLHSGPKGLKITKEGLLEWTPAAGQAGSHKLLVGVVTDKMSGADIYTLVVRAAGVAEPPKGDSVAAGSEADKPLPPDLDLVPGDGVAFLSLQVAETWKNPVLVPVRELAETDKTISGTLLGLKLMGLNPEDTERVIVVFWGKQRTAYSAGLVTTVKPYNRRQLALGLIGPDQREEKVGDKKIFSSPKSPFSLHPIDDRSFVYGRSAEVKKLLERPGRPTRKAVWNDILRSAPQHTLQIGVQHELFPDNPKKDTPPPLAALNPLLDAHTAVATLDAGKNLRLTARLMFARDEEVKQAESAARTGLELAAVFRGQFAEQFKKQMPGGLPPPLAKLVSTMQDAQTAVKKATIQSKDCVLECQVNLESVDWPEALAAGTAMIFASANKSSPPGKPDKPAPTKVQAPKTPEEAEAALKQLGFTVHHLDEKLDKPVVYIETFSDKITDDQLLLLTPFRDSLTKLELLDARSLSDKGLKHLAGLSKLETLSISRAGLTGEGLADLKGLSGLRSLDLHDDKLTDAGLAHLKPFKMLTYLDLGGNKGITDKGVVHLRELQSLETLRMRGIGMTEKGIKELKDALTKTIVVADY